MEKFEFIRKDRANEMKVTILAVDKRDAWEELIKMKLNPDEYLLIRYEEQTY